MMEERGVAQHHHAHRLGHCLGRLSDRCRLDVGWSKHHAMK